MNKSEIIVMLVSIVGIIFLLYMYWIDFKNMDN